MQFFNLIERTLYSVSHYIQRDIEEMASIKNFMNNPFQFIAQMNLKAQKALLQTLMMERPGYSFIIEDYGTVHGSDKSHTIVISSIHTNDNILHGIPYIGISISLLFCNEIKIAIIYNPITKEIFYAEKEKGAFKNKKRIKCKDNPYNKQCMFINDPLFFSKTKQNSTIYYITNCPILDICYLALSKNNSGCFIINQDKEIFWKGSFSFLKEASSYHNISIQKDNDKNIIYQVNKL